MKDTGKRLTAEQIESVKENLNRPVMFLSGGQRIGGDETAQQEIHRYALAYGLPEISGYYGADLKTGIIYEA